MNYLENGKRIFCASNFPIESTAQKVKWETKKKQSKKAPNSWMRKSREKIEGPAIVKRKQWTYADLLVKNNHYKQDGKPADAVAVA